MRCNFIKIKKLEDNRSLFKCKRCRVTTKSPHDPELIYGECNDGLGDWIATFFRIIKFDKLYSGIRRLLKLSKQCGCKKRQNLLNHIKI